MACHRILAATYLMVGLICFSACSSPEVLPTQPNSPQTEPPQYAFDPGPAVQDEIIVECSDEAEEEKTTAQLVVIDPGHQLHADNDTESVGPGAEEYKAKVSGGTVGPFTGQPEYQLNLTVSLMLRDELVRRGYRVELTHEQADISLSNAERADIANAMNADAFVRIHANGSEDASRHGAMTICITPNNPFQPQIYECSSALADLVLTGLCEATGAVREGVWETDTMSGLNYSQVPCTIVEMGYLTNEEEDQLLADADYQRSIACGIADGIDQFLGGSVEE